MSDVEIEETEALAAAKQDQDSIQNQQTQDTSFMEKSTGNVQSEPSAEEERPILGFSTQAATSSLGQATGGNIKSLFQIPVPVSIPDEMAALLKRHCVLTDHEVDAIVLWLISSHMINTFRIFPKLSLISPEKRCGKTTTMEVIHSLSNQGILTSNLSSASIFRMQFQPTLLIDEADTFLKSGDPQLVGLINSSHTKAAAKVMRCVGENFETKEFSTWMPMVLASIGVLQPTIMDRSIVINLRRKKTHEHTDPIPVDLLALKESLRKRIQDWCKLNESVIRTSLIKPPSVGNDRAADNWSPLFNVANTIGSAWLGRCEISYKSLTDTAELEIPTQLLHDIHTFFQSYVETRVASATLVEELCKDSTGPWQTCSNGRSLSQHQLAKLLSPYGIKPWNIRFGDKTHRGYEKDQFADAFERYLS